MFVALLLGVRWLEGTARTQSGSDPAGRWRRARGRSLAFAGQGDGSDGPEDVDALQPGTGSGCGPVKQSRWMVSSTARSPLRRIPLTGESVSVRRQRGENVVAGAINLRALITVRATATAATSTEQRLLLLADNATKPETLAFADIVASLLHASVALLAIGTFVALLPAGVATGLNAPLRC